jgi:hypothetical protein
MATYCSSHVRSVHENGDETILQTRWHFGGSWRGSGNRMTRDKGAPVKFRQTPELPQNSVPMQTRTSTRFMLGSRVNAPHTQTQAFGSTVSIGGNLGFATQPLRERQNVEV